MLEVALGHKIKDSGWLLLHDIPMPLRWDHPLHSFQKTLAGYTLEIKVVRALGDSPDVV